MTTCCLHGHFRRRKTFISKQPQTLGDQTKTKRRYILQPRGSVDSDGPTDDNAKLDADCIESDSLIKG